MKNLFYSFFLSIVMISGFFHYTQLEHYQATPPPPIGSILEPFRDRGVHVRAKAYDAHESRAYLNRDLLAKGLQPIQVTIQNNSARSYVLSKGGIDLDGLSASSVAHTVNRGYIPRAIGFKVAAFFFWPFVIPSAIDSIITFVHHREMKGDYTAKSLKVEGEVLLPYSTTHRVVFVRHHQLTDHFTLYLRDGENGRCYPYSIKVEMS